MKARLLVIMIFFLVPTSVFSQETALVPIQELTYFRDQRLIKILWLPNQIVLATEIEVVGFNGSYTSLLQLSGGERVITLAEIQNELVALIEVSPGLVYIHNLTTNKISNRFQVDSEPIVEASFHPNSPLIAVVSRQCPNYADCYVGDYIMDEAAFVYSWNYEQGELVTTFPSLYSSGFQFSPNGQYLATEDVLEGIRIWQLENESLKASVITFGRFAFSHNGDFLIFDYAGFPFMGDMTTGNISLLNLTTEEIQRDIQRTTTRANSIAVDPTDNLVASSNLDGTFVTNLHTGEERLLSQTSFIEMAFDSNGYYLAISNIEGIVSIWDLSSLY